MARAMHKLTARAAETISKPGRHAKIAADPDALIIVSREGARGDLSALCAAKARGTGAR